MDSSFACDATIRNAQFSTTTQRQTDSRRSSRDIQNMFDMLKKQQLTLNIDLVQTPFTCNDSFIVEHLIGFTLTPLLISDCQARSNATIISLAIAVPAHNIAVRIILPGIKTVGAIRLGLSGPAAVSADER